MGQLSYKPWLDETDPDDVFFASVHLHAGEHDKIGEQSESERMGKRQNERARMGRKASRVRVSERARQNDSRRTGKESMQ